MAILLVLCREQLGHKYALYFHKTWEATGCANVAGGWRSLGGWGMRMSEAKKASPQGSPTACQDFVGWWDYQGLWKQSGHFET
jgi:hypothetical protein